MKVQKMGSGQKGIAKVRMSGEKVEVLFKDTTKPIRLSRENCPDYTKAGELYVNMNAEGDTIIGLHPVNGMYRAKFSRFYSRENEVPAPQEKPGGTFQRKDGKGSFTVKPFLQFTPIMKITDEKYKGMEVVDYLRYMFVEDEDGNVMIKGGGKPAERLEAFLRVNGVLDSVLEYSDNILPRLSKKIKANGETFMVLIKDGNLQDYMELPSDDPDEDDENPDEKESPSKAEEAPKASKKSDDDEDGDDVPWDAFDGDEDDKE